ncbi:hypothetical protein B296_00050757 [Ensete ventricosum]|uniref:Uncharacterized protein n=1 Tax=Ensete ventricosum TaxID=4639 RepID=A0A426Y6B6_ENSVE|nr:hypothetical protein B296_00050757 [Ensete ventricosum]
MLRLLARVQAVVGANDPRVTARRRTKNCNLGTGRDTTNQQRVTYHRSQQAERFKKQSQRRRQAASQSRDSDSIAPLLHCPRRNLDETHSTFSNSEAMGNEPWKP